MKIINSFPGYEYIPFGEDKKPHNMYRGEDVGFGGYVYAEPGMYGRVVCFDVSGMHPASIRAMNCFGEYTKNFGDLVDARLAIKHKDFETARNMLNGRLAPYLDDESKAKDLAKALKICVNSVYGVTAANFDNPFRDVRNKNNIVACRGALFMVNLKHEVQNRGFKVVHCKTDSIKVLEPNEEITKFIMDYGKKYSYSFEIEHIFEKICLVNDAVYVAKLAEDDPEDPGKWTATGAQFQVPYVFKTLFSREPIEFKDLCETKSVKSALYLDLNESLPDVSGLEKQLDKIVKTAKKNGVELDVSGNSGDGELDPLIKQIAEGHDYKFIGKVGNFCPIIPGHGGGLLVRDQNGKYYNVTGTTGYRWLESELVRGTNEEYIDKSYYNSLVDAAVETISQYGDFEWFVSDDVEYKLSDDGECKFILNKQPKVPCGDNKFETCFDCPKFDSHECKLGYDLSSYLIQK